MKEWSNAGKWLGGVLGGCVATIAAAYLLYWVPPERLLGRPAAKPEAKVDEGTNPGGSGPADPPASAPAASQPREEPVKTPPVPGPLSAPAKGAEQEDLRARPITAILAPGTPAVLSPIGTVVSLAFRDTLGSRYAEIVVDPPSQKSFRFPARSAGDPGKLFEANGQQYEIRVVALDWQAMRAHITVRPASASGS